MLGKERSRPETEEVFLYEPPEDLLNKTAEFYLPLSLDKIPSTRTVEEDLGFERLTVGAGPGPRNKNTRKTPLVVRGAFTVNRSKVDSKLSDTSTQKDSQPRDSASARTLALAAEACFALNPPTPKDRTLPKLSLKRNSSGSNFALQTQTREPGPGVKQDFIELSRNLAKSRGTFKTKPGFALAEATFSQTSTRGTALGSPQDTRLPKGPVFEFAKEKPGSVRRAHQMVSSYPPLSNTEQPGQAESSTASKRLSKQQSNIITRIFREL